MAILFEHDSCPIALGVFPRSAGILSDLAIFVQYTVYGLLQKVYPESAWYV